VADDDPALEPAGTDLVDVLRLGNFPAARSDAAMVNDQQCRLRPVGKP
jgi:hypothetical protein